MSEQVQEDDFTYTEGMDTDGMEDEVVIDHPGQQLAEGDDDQEAETETVKVEEEKEEKAEGDTLELGNKFDGVKYDEKQQAHIEEKIKGPLVGKLKETHEENTYLRNLLQKHGITEEEKPPEVPPRPDPFDADFDQKMEERDKIIEQRANWSSFQQVRDQQQQQAVLADLQTRNDTYYSRAKEAGINQDQLLAAGQNVLSTQPNPTTIDYIMRHPEGPKLTMFLGDNPGVLSQISTVSPLQAVELITTKIVPHIKGEGKKKEQIQNQPPEPTEQLKGGGAAAVSEEDAEIADGGFEYD